MSICAPVEDRLGRLALRRLVGLIGRTQLRVLVDAVETRTASRPSESSREPSCSCSVTRGC